jgi:hypothetical protein
VSEKKPDITPEALEAEGWLNSTLGGYIKAEGMLTLKVWQGCSNWWFASAAFLGYGPPEKIATMSDLRQLVAVLKGKK